ncbi:MAG: pyridoxamine 5'-phosphate oxidase family protein [Rhodocyclaceae bacterium]
MPATGDAALSSRVLDYLAGHRVLTLATHGPQGVWAAALFYANEGFRLYFLSSPSSRHCMDLAADPRVAGTVQDECSDWREIRGLQFEGLAREISSEQVRCARRLYAAKHPLIDRLAGAPPAIVEAMARVRWYAIEVARIRLIDNSAGFGHREELLLAPAR